MASSLPVPLSAPSLPHESRGGSPTSAADVVGARLNQAPRSRVCSDILNINYVQRSRALRVAESLVRTRGRAWGLGGEGPEAGDRRQLLRLHGDSARLQLEPGISTWANWGRFWCPRAKNTHVAAGGPGSRGARERVGRTQEGPLAGSRPALSLSMPVLRGKCRQAVAGTFARSTGSSKCRLASQDTLQSAD